MKKQIKKFTLHSKLGTVSLDIAKREIGHGRFGNIPNEFILGEINLAECCDPELIEKINNAKFGDRIDLAYTSASMFNLYLKCQDPLEALKSDISYYEGIIITENSNIDYYNANIKEYKQKIKSRKKELKYLEGKCQ